MSAGVGGDGRIECPACGHELSMYHAPAPGGGERAATWVAAHWASWWVPTALFAGVAGWAIWNVTARPFEPYPVIIFAVISGVLATIAAAQGPLILLAQRRAAMNDRARDEESFRVATHSEADLHELIIKIDALTEKVERLETRSA
ncbi:MAG: DUF1003 domain-containing protein [Actinomycetota bacterium]